MESATNLTSLLLGGSGLKSGAVKPEVLKQDLLSVRASKQPVLVDCRIQALRTLAQTLLLVVESLGESANAGAVTSLDMKTEVRRFETELIRSALIRTGGRQRPAARILGVKVTTLNSKIKRYKIIIDEIPTASESA